MATPCTALELYRGPRTYRRMTFMPISFYAERGRAMSKLKLLIAVLTAI